MTPEQFVYWLQGYFELTLVDVEGVEISQYQAEVVYEHLKKVFDRQKMEETTSVVIPASKELKDIIWSQQGSVTVADKSEALDCCGG